MLMLKKNKQVKLINKNYEFDLDKIKSEANKIQSVNTPGQAAYYLTQGLPEIEKSKSQKKEASIQQTQQDNQNQQENTADSLKKEIDKLVDFNRFQVNSSSLK